NGTTIHLRGDRDRGLPPAKLDWPGVTDATAREVIWGVDTKATLDAIGAEITTDRDVRVDDEGVLHCRDDHGYALGFAVSTRKDSPLEFPQTNTVGSYARRNRIAEGSVRRRVAPARIGHVVYWAPGDVPAAARFYQRLGFKVTDDMSKGGLFMRCAGSCDHHSLLLQGGKAVGFQHVAYEFRDFDEVMLLGAQVEAKGWKTNVGPLRHNVSSTCSWYFWNPAGGLSEAYSDMDCVDDNWVPRTFRPGEDPDFYGSSWTARPEHANTPPGQWRNVHSAPGYPSHE
ncbi:MAG TPA: VOC family protein, partial [Stellaceae bacterium]|nr:VOC family protein [Stellaceae bacterium]